MDDEMDDAPGVTGIDDAQKTALVQAEVQRMKCLPPSSAYAIHRLKVLNKMLQLLSKVRSNTEAEELEALFAKMAF
ncbi:hypothetical protein M758_4G128000 [Ceratodon purpureus]|nr:hypothetical protein M758_4G128000 [Ceratodon purpureus]